MNYRLPWRISYETENSTPVEEIIASLEGFIVISGEVGEILEDLLPGFYVENSVVFIKSISQQSPLEEKIDWAIAAVVQEELGDSMAHIIDHIFGISPGHDINNVMTAIFFLAMVYGTRFIYKKFDDMFLHAPHLQASVDLFIEDISTSMGLSKDKIREVFEKRYGKKPPKKIAKAVTKFLKPSRSQGNTPIEINKSQFTKEIISEIPSEAQIKMEAAANTSRMISGVSVEFHAQDVDSGKKGWAAVVPSVSERRIQVSLMPGISPADLYNRPSVNADVVIEETADDSGENIPVRVHIVKIN